MMSEEEENFSLLPDKEKEGEAGDELGFDYLLGEVITFIEDNLGDRLG